MDKKITIGVGAVAIVGAFLVVEGIRGTKVANTLLSNAKAPPNKIAEGELISVILPAYKEESYIEDALIAIRNQTYSPIEIVVSDASDEESRVKTQTIADAYGASFVHTDIKNVSLGRNLGAQAATGDMIMFLDADCVMANDFTERLVRGLKQDGVHLAHGVDVYHTDSFLRDCDRQHSVFRSTRMIWTSIKPATYTTGRGIAMYANDFWEIGGYDEEIDPMKPHQREDKDLGKRVMQKWGPAALYIDRQAYVSEPPRRPNSLPGHPAWRDRAWRDGHPVD